MAKLNKNFNDSRAFKMLKKSLWIDYNFLIDKKNYIYFLYSDVDTNYMRYKKLNYFLNIMNEINKPSLINDDNLQYLTECLSQNSSDTLYNSIQSLYNESLEIEEKESVSNKEKINQDENKICLELLRKVFELIREHIKREIEEIIFDNNNIEIKIKNISDLFKLNSVETEILFREYLYLQDENFRNFINNNSMNQYYNGTYITSFKSISTLLNLTVSDVKKAYMKNSNLMRYELITEKTDIADDLMDFINGINNEPLINNYFTECMKKTYEIEDFSFDKDEIEIILNLVKSRKSGKGVKVLFYGQAGTGKTELARAISKKAELKTFELKENPKEDSNDKYFRLRALFAYENNIDIDRSILIVDEADEFLSTSFNIFQAYNNNQKGRFNQFFDESKTNQIWISNSVKSMDDSTKRRFDYCLEFKEMTMKQKVIIWKNVLKEYNIESIIDKNEIEELSEIYQSNAGNIANAVRNYVRIRKDDNNKEYFMKIVDSSLKSYIKLKDPDYKVNNKTLLSHKYTLGGININGKCDDYFRIIDNFNKQWGKNDQIIKNMNILMYGPSGTGKTEFVKYISKRLNRKLIIKTAGDLLSKWVGGTESNISEVFRQTENEEGILFIDETDSLLRSRDKAKNNWETTQVNEILVRMEDFKGIFISATNRLDDLDTAVIRRFNLKIEFDYLRPEGVKELCKIYFSEMIEKDTIEDLIKNAEILKYLTPGDFKIVYQKLFFLTRLYYFYKK